MQGAGCRAGDQTAPCALHARCTARAPPQRLATGTVRLGLAASPHCPPGYALHSSGSSSASHLGAPPLLPSDWLSGPSVFCHDSNPRLPPGPHLPAPHTLRDHSRDPSLSQQPRLHTSAIGFRDVRLLHVYQSLLRPTPIGQNSANRDVAWTPPATGAGGLREAGLWLLEEALAAAAKATRPSR